MAALSFVDRDRVWIKAAVGFEGGELPRRSAFCSHTVNLQSVFVVTNALADERFAANPLVASPPHIRFYAGAAVHAASGHPVGSLCIFDVVPRGLDAGQRQCLQSMAHYAANEMMVRQYVGHRALPSGA